MVIRSPVFTYESPALPDMVTSGSSSDASCKDMIPAPHASGPDFAEVSMLRCISSGVAKGFASSNSAAIPATCGADAEVPEKAPPGVLTPSYPHISGFSRPSSVGAHSS